MREWLTVIVVLLILGILLDGIRRMRNARRDNLRMSPHIYKRSTTAAKEPGEKRDLYTSELPNGGARVVAGGDTARVKKTAPAEQQTPQQTHLNLDESVPLLMESVGDDSEPKLTASEEDMSFARDEENRIEPTFSTEEGSTSPDSGGSAISSAPEEVLVINIMAREGELFLGEPLLNAILQSGLRFGDMDIFHRHSDPMGTGPILFSLANMVKPGYFDLDAMAEFTTPGVSMFMTLPLDHDNMQAFDTMADAARQICDAMGGELKDENRSVMTRQTLEHCRQRIRDFERRQLSRSPA